MTGGGHRRAYGRRPPRPARRKPRRPSWWRRAWTWAARARERVGAAWAKLPTWARLALMMFAGALVTSVCAECGDACPFRHLCRALMAMFDWGSRAASAGVAM